MSHSNANERECYICKCVESDSDEEKLIQQKCACSPYVHSQCLREFCMGYWHKTTCSTCKEVIRNVSIQPPPFYIAFWYFLKDACTCVRLGEFFSPLWAMTAKIARDRSLMMVGIRELLIWAGVYVFICLLRNYFVVNAAGLRFVTGWEIVLLIGYSLWRRAKSYVWMLMMLMSLIRLFAVVCLTNQTVYTLRDLFAGQSLLVIWERPHTENNSEGNTEEEEDLHIEERPLYLYNIDEEYALVRLHFSSYIRPWLVSTGLPVCFIESGIGTIIRMLHVVMSDTPYSTLIDYWTQAYRRNWGLCDDHHISLRALEQDVHGAWRGYNHMAYPLCVEYDRRTGLKVISDLPESHVEEPLEEHWVVNENEQEQEQQASPFPPGPAWWWAYFERFLFYDWFRHWKDAMNPHGNEGEMKTTNNFFSRSGNELITILVNVLLTMVRYSFWKFSAAWFLGLMLVGGRIVTDVPPDMTIPALIASIFSVYMTVNVNALGNAIGSRQLCGELLIFPYVLCGELCRYFLRTEICGFHMATAATILFVHQYWSLVYDDVHLLAPSSSLYRYKEQDAGLLKTSNTDSRKKRNDMSSYAERQNDSADNRSWPPLSLSWDTLLDYLNISDSSLILVYYNTYVFRRVADIACPVTVLCMLGVVGDVSVEAIRRSWLSVSSFGCVYLLMTIISACCGSLSSKRGYTVRVAVYMSQMLCLYGLAYTTVDSSWGTPQKNTGGDFSSVFYMIVCPWLCKCGVDAFESIHSAYSRVKNGYHILPTLRFPRFTQKPEACSLKVKTCSWANHPTFITLEQGLSNKYKGTRFICRRPVKRWGNIYALWGYTACIALLYVNLGIFSAIALLPFISHWPLLGCKILPVIVPFLCVYIVPPVTRGIVQKISWCMYEAEFKTTQLVSFYSRVIDGNGPRLWSLLEDCFNDASLPLSDRMLWTWLCQMLTIGWVSLPTDSCDVCTWREASSSLPLLLEMICSRTCVLTLWYLVSYLTRWCFQWSVYINRLDEIARIRHCVITTHDVEETQENMCGLLWLCLHSLYIFTLQSLGAWKSQEEQWSFIQFYVCMAFFCENLLPYVMSHIGQKIQEFRNYLQHTYMKLGWKMSAEEVNDSGRGNLTSAT